MTRSLLTTPRICWLATAVLLVNSAAACPAEQRISHPILISWNAPDRGWVFELSEDVRPGFYTLGDAKEFAEFMIASRAGLSIPNIERTFALSTIRGHHINLRCREIAWVAFAGTSIRFPPTAIINRLKRSAGKNEVVLTQDVRRLH